MTLKEKIKNVRSSIVAIGFSPSEGRMTIIGSGFCVSSDGKILTAAHIYNQVPPEFRSKLMGMTMIKNDANGMEQYEWLPLRFLKKEDAHDIALFHIADHKGTLLSPLTLGDSETIDVGQDAYFIGFPYAAPLMNDGFGITLIVNKTIISNIKRDGTDPAHPRNWFIVDAISNPGNSGCPLIDIETNVVIGIMTIAFNIKSQMPKYGDLDVKAPMHIAGAKPINLAKGLI